MMVTTTTYRNKLVTDIPNPLTAPNLSGVTELLMNSAWHTKQLLIAALMMSNIINRELHNTAGLEEYKHTTIIHTDMTSYGVVAYFSLRYVSEGNNGSKMIKSEVWIWCVYIKGNWIEQLIVGYK